MDHSFLTICREDKRMPYHRVPIDIGGQKRHAFLLTSINKDNQAQRDTLVLSNADEVIALLPREAQRDWQAFSKELVSLRTAWKFHGIPTMKRALRLYNQGDALTNFQLTTLAHRFGAVPALIIGEVDEFKIALFSDRFGRQFPQHKETEAELIEMQESLDKYLPALFPAYFEQIGFYLKAVFFTAHEEQVLNFCLRVRTLIMTSIRGKLDSIDSCPKGFKKAELLNKALVKKYARQIEEARAVDCLAHMIVNYIYSAFCLEHRALEYNERLQSLLGESDLFEDSSVALMKRCGEEMTNPGNDGRLLHEITTHRLPRQPWLKSLAESSAFVSEIILSTGREHLDIPRVFLTYHFETADSEKLYEGLKNLLQKKHAPARIIRGRHLGPDIRWSVLARIWSADYHLLALPSSWDKTDGQQKHLRSENNWVNVELLYGQLIQKELRIITVEPANDGLIEEFGNHLRDYTDTKEIEQIDEEEWRNFLPGAKERLRKSLRNQQHLRCDVANLDEEFWTNLKSQVLDLAGKKLIHLLFHAWCYFFEPPDWSVAQAIIMMAANKDQEFTTKEITTFIQGLAEKDDRFEWARGTKSYSSLENNVRGRMKKLTDFKLDLSEGVFPILLLRSNPQRVRIRIVAAYKLLAKKFGLTADLTDLRKIFTMLSTPRWD
jgi:hypothetical protein